MTRRLPLVAFALASAGIVAGCFLWAGPDESAVRYTPEVAGVVVRRDGENAGFRYTLSDGRSLWLEQEIQYLVGGTPDVGDLLLAGFQPSRWVTAAGPAPNGQGWPPGCFTRSGFAFERGEWVEIEITVRIERAYLRVPKAEGFEAEAGLGGELSGSGICLDAQGRAFDTFGSGVL